MGSFRDQVRARIQESRSETEHFPIPGTDRMLWGEFQRIPWEVAKRAGQRYDKDRKKDPEAEWKACADQIAGALLDLYGKDGNGKRVGLDDKDPDSPLTFRDPRLAEALGLAPDDKSPVRSQVEQLFPGKLAIVAFQQKLLAWSQGVDEEELEELAGE